MHYARRIVKQHTARTLYYTMQYNNNFVAHSSVQPCIDHDIIIHALQYNNNFVAQVAAMEARAATLGHANELIYMFPENTGLNAADQAKAIAAGE